MSGVGQSAENGLPEFGGSLGTSAPVDSPKPRAECDNYRPPLTCLTAPSTETGRCDKCQARVLPPADLCPEFVDTGRCGHSDAEHDALADAPLPPGGGDDR